MSGGEAGATRETMEYLSILGVLNEKFFICCKWSRFYYQNLFVQKGIGAAVVIVISFFECEYSMSVYCHHYRPGISCGQIYLWYSELEPYIGRGHQYRLRCGLVQSGEWGREHFTKTLSMSYSPPQSGSEVVPVKVSMGSPWGSKIRFKKMAAKAGLAAVFFHSMASCFVHL